MAYVLKSDVVVADPTGRFPYLTRYGIAHGDLAKYMTALEARGFAMPQADFTAFKTFIDTLEAAGLWGKLLEVYPFYGSDFSHMTVKLKSKLAAAELAALNGMSASRFEGANGMLLGTNNATYANNDSPAFDTGFTAATLGRRWGATFYVDASSGLGYTSGTAERVLFGAVYDAGGLRQTQVGLRFEDGGVRRLSLANSAGKSMITLPAVPTGVVRAQADQTAFSALVDSTSYSVSGAQDLAADLNRKVWLLAKNPAPGGTITTGFNGKVRFAAFDDGTIPANSVATYRDAVVALMTALGKSF